LRQQEVKDKFLGESKSIYIFGYLAANHCVDFEAFAEVISLKAV
jgi:hypothetical protein